MGILRKGGLAIVGSIPVGYIGLQWWNERRRWNDQLNSLASTLDKSEVKRALEWRPPSRQTLLTNLREDFFDLVIIGGGATGTGCALDAASRGLKVALVERDDFSAGTSSKSTKLVHGGVRYLEKAFFNRDWNQFEMVREALHERATFLRIVPHLTTQLPIMIPVYCWWKIPYFWFGAKAYDLVAGSKGLQNSYFISRSEAMREFPMLKKDDLKGAIVYFDGMQNDARMNVALALTAIYHGATVLNYTEVKGLLKDEKGVVCGVQVEDQIGGDSIIVKAKGVINATGPFCDGIRKMDDPKCELLVQPSIGTHVVFPSYFSPRNMGLIDPASPDGRVIFFLPWEGNTLAGTTDAPFQMCFNPEPPAVDVKFIVNGAQKYLNPQMNISKEDILSAWSGVRPLVRDLTASSTESLLRNHAVLQSPSGLISIVGGKWTTYRKMASDTIDFAIESLNLSPKKNINCITENIPLIGSHGYQDNFSIVQLVHHLGLEPAIAEHLAHNYGDRAANVVALQPATAKDNTLVPGYPFQKGEIIYAIRFEYAQSVVDVISRRTRLAHLDCQATLNILPKIIEIMSEELNWSSDQKKNQLKDALNFLISCGSANIVPIHHNEIHQKWLEKCRNIYCNTASSNLPDNRSINRLTREEAIEGWRQLLKSINHEAGDYSEVYKLTADYANHSKLDSYDYEAFVIGADFLKDILDQTR